MEKEQSTFEQECKNLGIDTEFNTPKTPQAKNELADKVLEDFSRDYADIDKAISILQQEERKNGVAEPKPTQEAQEQEQDTDIHREKNELDRAISSIAQTRSLTDILKAIYAIEKALYELKISQKKPSPEACLKQIQDSKGKPLTMDYLKEGIQKLKSGKDKIQDYAKNLRLQRAFAKGLSKDISMFEMVESKESKSAYIKRIDEKLIQAREKFPNLQENFPKMLKAATEIIQPIERGKNIAKTIAVGAALSL